MLHHDQETIIAQCSPKGSGAVALIRMSGEDVSKIARNISELASGKNIDEVSSHTIHYGYVIDQKKKRIDQVLFLVMHGPKTFTGQDTIEITCHNNPFLVETIIEQAIAHGARLAQEGEFSKRAVLNSKIDVLQAEAINELIHASTQQALKQSLAQVEGSFSKWIHHIEQELVKNLALSDASFEFIDEDDTFGDQIKRSIEQLLPQIEHIKQLFNQQQQIKEGFRIALLGSVNAGKSSLFNALLKTNRAIVTDIAGTTRDVIEAGLYRNGNYITFVDTAGLRQTDNEIEQQGIERSYREAEKADIVLLVYDGSRKLSDQERVVYGDLRKKYYDKVVVICHKVDLFYEHNQIYESELSVSSQTRTNIDQLKHIIDEKIIELFSSISCPFLLNQRQFNLLRTLEKKLKELKNVVNGDIAYELVSYHLVDALETISELSGKTISEKGMDALFKEFCIGK